MNQPEDLPLEVLERARALGFLGPGSVEVARAHAGGYAEVVETTLDEPPRSVVDLGSGGGVPGLVLAARWPQCRISLVESNHRRSEYLRTVVTGQGWDGRVVVVEERAEVLGREPDFREQLSLVVARSFAEPAVTAEIAAGFVEVGGLLVVSEPPEPDPDRWPEAALAAMGFGPADRITVRTGSFVVIRKTNAAPANHSARGRATGQASAVVMFHVEHCCVPGRGEYDAPARGMGCITGPAFPLPL